MKISTTAALLVTFALIPGCALFEKEEIKGTDARGGERLLYEWVLEEVRYEDGRDSFKPERYEGFTLHPNGRMTWSDGCNRLFARYEAGNGKFRVVSEVGSTLIGCPFEIEDIHYENATRYELEADVLTLHTSSQAYLLRRYAYSPLSMSDWSLGSIVEKKSGEARDLDRFRMAYHELFLSIEDDKEFTFTDLDGEHYAGQLTVEGARISGMAFDEPSRERLAGKEKEYDYLLDKKRGYQRTDEKYATSYVDEVEWGKIHSFKVENGTLELHSDTHIYMFNAR